MLRQFRPVALLARCRPSQRLLSSIHSAAVHRPQTRVVPAVKFFNSPSVRRYGVLEEDSHAPVIDFAKVKSIAEEKKPDVVLVDTREPEEYAEGHIPGAVNIPVNSSPGALGLPEEKFESTFGFPKPEPSQTLVFYCLAGVRSTMAEELAGTFGYDKRLNYVGSWADWTDKKGPVEVPKQEKPEPEADKK
ncbi:hypothetical protein OGAPHI_006067 [Ogataea philodendri]|uniref:Rhodanese domain-containing protein n=1 Tax=Ogataea philodendri TaxID=1378263 RepID=A0A9P8NXT9_9ASCO|nr:uncharacterized protein OGAPHI_006067 [Ogataea philodendri]KAH3661888.1 hypothetical protein OGAPHI_006067 [Ogataea philodendri]